jgi:hypothetical protein
VVFSRVHPLVESDPAQRTQSRQDTPAAEAVAWLEDPQPIPKAELRDQIARQIAEALGWPLTHVQEAITEAHEQDPEKRQCLVSRQTK